MHTTGTMHMIGDDAAENISSSRRVESVPVRVIVQRVKNGYLVRVNRGETEVFTTVLEVFDRLRAVL